MQRLYTLEGQQQSIGSENKRKALNYTLPIANYWKIEKIPDRILPHDADNTINRQAPKYFQYDSRNEKIY